MPAASPAAIRASSPECANCSAVRTQNWAKPRLLMFGSLQAYGTDGLPGTTAIRQIRSLHVLVAPEQSLPNEAGRASGGPTCSRSPDRFPAGKAPVNLKADGEGIRECGFPASVRDASERGRSS